MNSFSSSHPNSNSQLQSPIYPPSANVVHDPPCTTYPQSSPYDKYFGSPSTRSHAPSLDRSTRPNPRLFGHVPGVSLGQAWATRAQVSQAGIHAPYQSGISGTAQRGGAESVVLNGGYPDGDCGDIIWYMGSGGFNNLYTGKKCLMMQSDQPPSRPANRAMQESFYTGEPIRVVRGADDTRSPWAPTYGYRYDGLYIVTRAEKILDPTGLTPYQCLVWRLERLISSSYVIPIKPGYESRAVERASIGRRRKREEDEPELLVSSPPFPPPRPRILQSIDNQRNSTQSVSTLPKISKNQSSNHSVKLVTTPRPLHIAAKSAKPKSTSSCQVKPTSHCTKGLDSLEIKNKLSQLKFSKITAVAAPVPPCAGSPQASALPVALTASAGQATTLPASSHPTPSNLQRELPSSFAEPPRTLAGPNSPSPSSHGCTSITLSGSTTAQLPEPSAPAIQNFERETTCSFPSHLDRSLNLATKPPLLSDPPETVRARSPSPTHVPTDVQMEEAGLLSPLPSHDFTVPACQVRIASPIPNPHLSEVTSQNLDMTSDQDLNGITECSKPNGNKKMQCDLEPSVTPETFEELRLCPINNSLLEISPMEIEGTDVKPNMLKACGIQDEKMRFSQGLSFDSGYQSNGQKEHKLIGHQDTQIITDQEEEKKIKVEHVDQLNLVPWGNQISFWDQDLILKDQLDNTPIDFDQLSKKYIVGGFELIDEIDELDEIDQLDDNDDELSF